MSQQNKNLIYRIGVWSVLFTKDIDLSNMVAVAHIISKLIIYYFCSCVYVVKLISIYISITIKWIDFYSKTLFFVYNFNIGVKLK